MSSGFDDPASVNRLKRALDSAFGEGRVQFDEHASKHLLIVAVDSDIAGFTIVNGNARQGFESAYRAFRDMYASRHTEWATKNLSFTVCRTKSGQQDEEFFEKQMLDVLFCKKYVINLPEDDAKLEELVARLPFVPLRMDQGAGIQRAVSAQTLLQRWKLSAALARQIVAPGKASKESIVDGLLRKAIPTFEDPGPEDVSADKAEQRPSSSIRLKGLKIREFRAYRDESFDLDSDVVLLYGLTLHR